METYTEWVDGKIEERPYLVKGVVSPNRDGDLIIHGPLTTDPSYSCVVNARELYEALDAYFKEDVAGRGERS